MNDKAYIQHLLDRYMAATASEDEERRLREWFAAQDNVPEEWQAYAVLLTGRAAVAPRRHRLAKWAASAAAAVVIVAAGLFALHAPLQPAQPVTQTVAPAAPAAVRPPAAAEKTAPAEPRLAAAMRKAQPALRSVPAVAERAEEVPAPAEPPVEEAPPSPEALQLVEELLAQAMENKEDKEERMCRELIEEVLHNIYYTSHQTELTL
ncbi:MAG: hypothetical protein PUC38_01635 [Bacteroidales bacterium]|nr:hypothetical protein [Bacteroidales bacterium]